MHGPCFCMNCQHSKPFPPYHSLRNATPSEATFSPAFEQHVDTTQQPDTSRPTTSLPLETISHCLAHRNFQNLMTGSLHNAWNHHTLSPAINKNTWPIRISISQNMLKARHLSDKVQNPFINFTLILRETPFVLESLQQQTIQPTSSLSPHLEN
jgi:hypothetical protein